MNKQEVVHHFEFGIRQFNAGEPIPDNRCQAMGWRFARDMEREKELRLDTAFEAFIEKGASTNKPEGR
jgi:hypothetical protein